MAPRRRTESSENLPDNLYKNGDYYRYKNPRTKKFFGMGTDKHEAILAARQLNGILAPKSNLIRKVMGEAPNTWSELIKRYITERQPVENKKPSTVKEENWRLQHIVDALGTTQLEDTTQRLVSNFLSNTFAGNSYTKHRGTMIKLMAFGIASGMFPDGYKNLAEATLPARESPKLRQVLTYEQYQAIRECADDWLKIAMDFSLVTLQRRSDVIKAKYSDIEGQELKIIQAKTERHGERAYLRIRIGAALNDIISKSRSIQPVCPYIIHRMPERKVSFEGQEHWAQLRDQTLTKEFNKARDRSGLFKNHTTGEAPTFHEIRGLGGSLYLKQGYSKEYVNLLMGHTTQRMTDQYTDQHLNWTKCAAELALI